MVSRETLLADGLRSIGLPHPISDDALRRLSDLAMLLGGRAVPRGFLGPRERERIVPRHVLECAALLRWLPDAGPIVDVGSGAGLPGLVIACLVPGPIVLVESHGRRAAFLREASFHLGLPVQVVERRAEEAGRGEFRESAAAATARALAPAPETLELTMPFVRPGGVVVVLVGRPDEQAVAATGAAADVLGGAIPRAERFEVPGAKEARWVMIVQKLRDTPDRFPRPPGPRRRRPAGSDVV